MYFSLLSKWHDMNSNCDISIRTLLEIRYHLILEEANTITVISKYINRKYIESKMTNNKHWTGGKRDRVWAKTVAGWKAKTERGAIKYQ